MENIFFTALTCVPVIFLTYAFRNMTKELNDIYQELATLNQRIVNIEIKLNTKEIK